MARPGSAASAHWLQEFLLLAAIWGASFMFMQLAVRDFGPWATAGIRVGSLGRQEKCCGEPARKMGNEYLYQTMAGENIGAIEAEYAKKLPSHPDNAAKQLTIDLDWYIKHEADASAKYQNMLTE